MKPSLTDELCTRCGLCCDGSLFADVELAGDAEAAVLESMGLEVDEDDAEGSLLLLPCRALQGTRCGVYVHRPKCCRTFECRLLQQARRGDVAVERAQQQIAEAQSGIGRVRELLTQLGQRDARLPLRERYAEALTRNDDADQGAKRKVVELKAAMTAVEALIRGTFLRGQGFRGP